MDENKEIETTSEEFEEVTEEIAEEVKEEAVGEIAEEVVEETEETAEEIAEEASEEDFAVVYSEDAEKEEEAPKKSIKGIIIGAVAAIIVILAAIFAFKTFGGSTEGSGNLYSRGFATIKGSDVYHVNFSDYKMYKTSLKTGESQCISDDYAVYISNYKNDIYYLGYSIDEEAQSFEYAFKKYSDKGDHKIITRTEIIDPQYSGDYVYYLVSVPEVYSGYSSRIYRVNLSGEEEPELVSDVLCVSFYVDGNDLYYCDVQTTAFMKVDLEKTVKYVKENPLSEGATRSSEEFGAEKVIESIITCATRSGNKLYYIDAQSEYMLMTYDLRTGEVLPVNNGLKVGAINIYGDYIYYFDYSDYAVYRMNLDGSNVIKVTGSGFGYISLSHDKFMSMEFTEDFKQYLTVCDLDGNVLMEVGLPEEEEVLYDESAIPEEELMEAEGEEGIETVADLEE